MKSERIVSFIANLVPSYHGKQRGAVWCAESLDDGTVIVPIDESESEEEEGWVKVYWQGDPGKKTEAFGDHMATIAVVRHVQLHYTGQSVDRINAELEGLAQHYAFKTGGSLYLPYERVSRDLSSAIHEALGRLGEAGLIEVLKKAIGF